MELKNQRKNDLSNVLLWLVPTIGAIIIFMSVILSSCSPTYVLRNRFDDYYSISQIDSIILQEGLPKDLTKWNSSFMVDEDKNIIKQYMYIPKQDTAIYVITDCDSVYRFKKRVKIKLDK